MAAEATAKIVTVEQLRNYLGADSEKDSEIKALLAAAIESLCRATGIDWTQRRKVDTFNEAIRVQVYLSYYAVRDGTKNTEFLQEYLTGLICALQLCTGEVDADGDGQESPNIDVD